MLFVVLTTARSVLTTPTVNNARLVVSCSVLARFCAFTGGFYKTIDPGAKSIDRTYEDQGNKSSRPYRILGSHAAPQSAQECAMARALFHGHETLAPLVYGL